MGLRCLRKPCCLLQRHRAAHQCWRQQSQSLEDCSLPRSPPFEYNVQHLSTQQVWATYNQLVQGSLACLGEFDLPAGGSTQNCGGARDESRKLEETGGLHVLQLLQNPAAPPAFIIFIFGAIASGLHRWEPGLSSAIPTVTSAKTRG